MKRDSTRCPKCNGQYAKTVSRREVRVGQHHAIIETRICRHCGTRFYCKQTEAKPA